MNLKTQKKSIGKSQIITLCDLIFSLLKHVNIKLPAPPEHTNTRINISITLLLRSSRAILEHLHNLLPFESAPGYNHRDTNNKFIVASAWQLLRKFCAFAGTVRRYICVREHLRIYVKNKVLGWLAQGARHPHRISRFANSRFFKLKFTQKRFTKPKTNFITREIFYSFTESGCKEQI